MGEIREISVSGQGGIREISASSAIRGISEKPADHLSYRGQEVDFFEDPMGDQLIARWKGGVLEFGSGHTQYNDDMEKVIDSELDTVARFRDWPGARVERFSNGGHSDRRLVCWGRTLKVWLDCCGLGDSDVASEALALLSATYPSGEAD